MGKLYKLMVLVLAASVMSAAAGCRQNADDANIAQSASADAQAPTVVEEIVIGNRDDSASTPTAPLTPKDDIYVILKTNVPSKGGNLEVVLFDIGNGKRVGIRTETISPDHPGTSKLTFRSNDGWAPGRYLLEIKIDGKLAGRRDFDVIDLPPSPSPDS